MKNEHLALKDKYMEDNNCIFIHIPKTAGRSILSALGIKFHCEHKTINDYIKELTEPVVKSRFKFTVIRNPWDRAVSWWGFFNAGNPNQLEFEQWVINQARQYANNKNKNGMKIPLEQLSYCRTNSGEILMDTFLRFETIDKDFASIATRFNVPTKLPNIGKEDRAQNIRMITDMERIQEKKNEKLVAEGKSPVAIIPVVLTLNYKDMYKSQESIDAVADMNKELISIFKYNY